MVSAPDYYARHGWHSRWNYRRQPLLAYRLLSNLDLLRRLRARGRFFLDVGCGAAASEETAIFSKLYERRIFIDLSYEGISQARERYGNDAWYVVGDCRQLPFSDQAFDQVFSAMMFQHVEGGDKGQLDAINEMRRVGAQVLLTTTQGREGPLLRPVKRLLPASELYSEPRPANWFERSGGRVFSYRLLPNALVRGGPIGWLTVGFARWLERFAPPRWAHYITVIWEPLTGQDPKGDDR